MFNTLRSLVKLRRRYTNNNKNYINNNIIRRSTSVINGLRKRVKTNNVLKNAIIAGGLLLCSSVCYNAAAAEREEENNNENNNNNNKKEQEQDGQEISEGKIKKRDEYDIVIVGSSRNAMKVLSRLLELAPDKHVLLVPDTKNPFTEETVELLPPNVDIRPADRLSLDKPRTIEIGEEQIRFNNCLIVSDELSKPFPSPLPKDKNIIDIYQLYKTIREEKKFNEIVVIGGGFNGCVAVEYFRSLGKKVTMIAPSGVLRKVFPDDLANYHEEKFIKNGIEVIKGSRAKEIREIPSTDENNNKKYTIILEDGREITTEAVGYALGTEISSGDFARASGLELDDTGRIVTSHFHVTDGVYAAGSVSYYNEQYSRFPIPLAGVDDSITNTLIPILNLRNQYTEYNYLRPISFSLFDDFYVAHGDINSSYDTVSVFTKGKIEGINAGEMEDEVYPKLDPPGYKKDREQRRAESKEQYIKSIQLKKLRKKGKQPPQEEEEQEQEQSENSEKSEKETILEFIKENEEIYDKVKLQLAQEIQDQKAFEDALGSDTTYQQNNQFEQGVIYYTKDNWVVGFVIKNMPHMYSYLRQKLYKYPEVGDKKSLINRQSYFRDRHTEDRVAKKRRKMKKEEAKKKEIEEKKKEAESS